MVSLLAICWMVAAVGCGRRGSTSLSGPGVTSVTPDTGTTAGGDVVTIDTVGFSDDFTVALPTAVTFGALSGTINSAIDADTISVTTPPGAAGSVHVTLTAGNAQTDALANGFNYVVPPCVLGQVTPGQGPDGGGTMVSIIGSDFEYADPTLEVTFNGTPGSAVTGKSDSLITVMTPPCLGCGTVDVRVTSTNTDCTLPGGFEYLPIPTCRIDSVAPSNGPLTKFTRVTITGAGFTEVTNVTFGGVSVSGMDVVPDSRITVTPPFDPLGDPQGDYDVDVTVVTSFATCTLPGAYHYESSALPCTIDNILPPNGTSQGGDIVTITGSVFRPVGILPSVTFGGAPALVDPLSNYYEITCITPPGIPGAVDVVVTNSTGGTCAWFGGFTYDPTGGMCNIAGITPPVGSAHGGEQVAITGTDFDPTWNQVFFGGNPVDQVISQSQTEIVVITPFGLPGPVDVVVFPLSGQLCISQGGFTYTGCGLLDFIPDGGALSGGNSVVIRGSGFDSDVEVFIGGNQAAVIPPPDTLQLVAVVPPGSAPGPVDVTLSNPTAGTSCTVVDGYTYRGCVITDVSPDSGEKLGGTAIAITGSDLGTGPGVPSIIIGGNWATDVQVSSGLIQCNTPPSLVEGAVDVEVFNTDGTTCSLPGGFSYNPGAGANCAITAIVPSHGRFDGAEFVRIEGSGFEAGPPDLAVLFGTKSATVTSVDPGGTWIDVITPKGVLFGPVDVHVFNAGGGVCTGGPYTYDTPPPFQQCNLFAEPTGMSPLAIPWDQGGPATVTGFCEPGFLLGFCPENVELQVMQDLTFSAPFYPQWGTCASLSVTIPPAPLATPGPAVLIVGTPGGNLWVFGFEFN